MVVICDDELQPTYARYIFRHALKAVYCTLLGH